MLCRPVHDWDVTTSARPEQVLALFAHCVPTGIRHGTVTVFEDGAQAEVTTFRADGAYHDGRHPDAVSFVTSLRGDLARRDFTVNAMAMDLRGNLYDYHGGQAPPCRMSVSARKRKKRCCLRGRSCWKKCFPPDC